MKHGSPDRGGDVIEAEAPFIDQVESQAGDFVRGLRLLLEHRRFLIRVALYALAASTILAFIIPKQYESTTRLAPPDNQNSAGMALLSGLTSNPALQMLSGNILGNKTTGAFFVGILKSRTVADHLIDRFDLRKVYGVSLYDKARKKLAARTTITEEQKSGIITVTVVDNDPKRAEALAAGYIEQLNNLVAQLSTSAAHRERVFLEGRLQEVKHDLDAASKEFGQFSSKNSMLDLKEQGRTMVEAAAMMNGQLIAAQSELRGLEQIYTPNNVRVRTVRARIAELQSQLDVLSGKAYGSNQTNAAPSGAPYPSIRELPMLGVTYVDLYRRNKIQEAVYETLTKEYELAKVQESKEIPTVKLLDAANAPERKSFPPRLAIMISGTLFAFACGIVWVLSVARWHQLAQEHPARQFVEAFICALKKDLSRVSAGRHLRSVTGRLRKRITRQRVSPQQTGAAAIEPCYPAEQKDVSD